MKGEGFVELKSRSGEIVLVVLLVVGVEEVTSDML